MGEFKEASWWSPEGDGRDVRCGLCPRSCRIPDGKVGYCGVRLNEAGRLVSLAYGHPAAVHVDPIEKKPLCAFLPGTRTFSIGTHGCNLGCRFCQNHHISKDVPEPEQFRSMRFVHPWRLAGDAIDIACESMSFTYNEPTVWAEYAIDLAKLAKDGGMATVLVTNGYISMEAAKDFYPHIDAANFDMKGFSEDFYWKMCGGSLQPVLDAMVYFRSLGKHLEVTNLVIPGRNDSEEMVDAFLAWAAEKLGLDVPLHFSAYRPMYKYVESPPTPPKTLHAIRERALKRGFSTVQLGNIGFWV